MYMGRKTHFGRNYFAKNIVLLKKQQKRRYDMRTYHTASTVLFIFIVVFYVIQ